MKKTCALMVAVLLMVTLVACGAPAAEIPAEIAVLEGTWIGTNILEDSYVFNADGTGHYDNPLLPYDFEYKVDGNKLDIYAVLFGSTSDSATELEFSIDGNKLTVLDIAMDTEYTYEKQ